ncbi:hypothetical protein RHGRI_012376 [Rhododendron griersonianum]|uniref:Uncharacterized protein n=1 Tax=Rhododendron griersonianum TaxID=479676 RepID=A0AAV6KQV1_9ERIC|nr:hypothetical protein RHGRI_012376 [Rhododendron griersonianum]
MGLFTGASIFDTLDDDFDLHWDLASPALHDSEFTSIPYSMTECQSMNVHSHIEMVTSKSSVKDPSIVVECTKGIVEDDNHGFHAFPTPPKGAEEMVPDNSNFQASPSPPPLSKSGVGYSADYKPISSYARSWNGQRLPSQQNVVSNITYGNDSAVGQMGTSSKGVCQNFLLPEIMIVVHVISANRTKPWIKCLPTMALIHPPHPHPHPPLTMVG